MFLACNRCPNPVTLIFIIVDYIYSKLVLMLAFFLGKILPLGCPSDHESNYVGSWLLH